MMLSKKARDLLDLALARSASDYNDVDVSTTEAREIEVKLR